MSESPARKIESAARVNFPPKTHIRQMSNKLEKHRKIGLKTKQPNMWIQAKQPNCDLYQ